MDVASWVLVLTLAHTHGRGLATAPVVYPTLEACNEAGERFADRWRYAGWQCLPGPERTDR